MAQLNTLHDLIESLAGQGNRPALLTMRREGIETWSYRRLHTEVLRIAGGLRGQEVGEGRYVALFAPNGPEWVAACLGAVGAGAVVVPLDVQLGSKSLQRILGDCELARIFTTAEHAKRLDDLDLKERPQPILLDADGSDERSWLRLSRDGRTLPEVDPKDETALFYTSGTTGPPKGVPLTHGNLVVQLNNLLEEELLTGEDRILQPLPFHHVYPFSMGMLAPLALGVPIVLPQSLDGSAGAAGAD